MYDLTFVIALPKKTLFYFERFGQEDLLFWGIVKLQGPRLS